MTANFEDRNCQLSANSLSAKRDALGMAGVEAVTLSVQFKMFVRGEGRNRRIESAKLFAALPSPTLGDRAASLKLGWRCGRTGVMDRSRVSIQRGSGVDDLERNQVGGRVG